MSTLEAVNGHYLNHVVDLSETTEVEASEDILSGSGMKLLAKGARIDARVKERLLEHKLAKPLETMMRVVGGVDSKEVDVVAQALFDKHPLLLKVCSNRSVSQLRAGLRGLRLTPQLDSLLSVYGKRAPHKLEHAVGVALLSGAMMEGLPRVESGAVQALMTAGLLHDVGELYIDPAFLQSGLRLSPQQWKHIATHPIVSARVLKQLPGAGPKVADAVLQHHERLDGFGYPMGLRADGLHIGGQVLAMAEMLMGLMETGANHAERAMVAVKLIPGEFNRHLLDHIVSAARDCASVPADAQAEANGLESAREFTAQMGAVIAAVERFSRIPASIRSELKSCSAELQALLDHATERCGRIGLAFSSTGLDSHSPEEFLARLESMDTGVQLEVGIVLREVRWRVGELGREVSLRAERFSRAEAECVRRHIDLSNASPESNQPAQAQRQAAPPTTEPPAASAAAAPAAAK
jgi:hypothetical protein